MAFFTTVFNFFSSLFGAFNTVTVGGTEAPLGVVLLSGAVLSICVAAFWVGR